MPLFTVSSEYKEGISSGGYDYVEAQNMLWALRIWEDKTGKTPGIIRLVSNGDVIREPVELLPSEPIPQDPRPPADDDLPF
jgi:hypothetical protein